MTPLLVGLFLIGLMVLANFWSSARTFDEARPLDVDDDLPWPEAAQASSVFSLTALYTAYLSVALLIGLPALTGVAIGTVLVLVLLRRAIERSGATNFEQFVDARLGTQAGFQPIALAYLLVAMQLGLAISEFVVLREVAVAGLGMMQRHALLIVLAGAVVAYYYCLVGGYRTLFRADVVQFLAVGIMCGVLAYNGIQRMLSGASLTVASRLVANPLFWNTGAPLRTPWDTVALTVTHVAIGFVMGAAYVAASPDTWKRVFVAVRKCPTAGAFWRLVVAGALPFVALLPFLIASPTPDAGRFIPVVFFFQAQQLTLANSSVVVGILGTFLSSFAGALLSVAQLMLLIRRARGQRSDLRTFRNTLGSTFLIALAAGLAFSTRGNPFFVGHILIGAYSIAGGVLLGTKGAARLMIAQRLRVVLTVLGFAWLWYLLRDAAMVNEWSAAREAQAIGVGCIMFLLALAATKFIAPRSLVTPPEEGPLNV
ncbi:MAG TPA: hypothetical protein VF618_12315 [Thermoanaerobaculia bacterium]